MGSVEHIPTAFARFNGDFIWLETYSGYRSYAQDGAVAPLVLNHDATDFELGAGVLDVISASRQIDISEIGSFFDAKDRQKRYDARVEEIIRMFDYKSRKELFRDMDVCSIKLRQNSIVITPLKHKKLEEWTMSADQDSKVLEVARCDTPESIGKSLRIGFSRCA